jgi:DNA-binding beta-propeller fold protein YncE
MANLTRYLPELAPKRLKKNLRRIWKVYINPPKETRIYVRPQSLPVIATKVDVKPTKGQPKQVMYDPKTGLAFVSCMSGHALQLFKIETNSITLQGEVPFEDQCVEVLLHDGKVFVTTNNFERPPHPIRNKLWILDAATQKVLSSIDTGGNWSKLIAISPKDNELLISNWHSHNISVIDIADLAHPKLKQILAWGEAPRGIAFTPDGTQAVVTGFYSGNLGILTRNPQTQQWESTFTGEPFDRPHYPGNMRHVLINNSGQTAIVSNLRRNLIHIWSIPERTFTASISVGRSPNSIDWVGHDEKEIVVSCRESDYVYRVDLVNQRVVGRSQPTGSKPTGLCSVDGGFLVTGFEANTLELHKFS